MNDRHIQDRQPTEAEVAFAEAMKDFFTISATEKYNAGEK